MNPACTAAIPNKRFRFLMSVLCLCAQCRCKKYLHTTTRGAAGSRCSSSCRSQACSSAATATRRCTTVAERGCWAVWRVDRRRWRACRAGATPQPWGTCFHRRTASSAPTPPYVGVTTTRTHYSQWASPAPARCPVSFTTTKTCHNHCLLLLFLLFWHAPLGVHSAIRRHQPAQRTVLGQVDCFVQCEVVGSQIAIDGVQPRDTRTPWWSLPVIWWGSH